MYREVRERSEDGSPPDVPMYSAIGVESIVRFGRCLGVVGVFWYKEGCPSERVKGKSWPDMGFGIEALSERSLSLECVIFPLRWLLPAKSSRRVRVWGWHFCC